MGKKNYEVGGEPMLLKNIKPTAPTRLAAEAKKNATLKQGCLQRYCR